MFIIGQKGTVLNTDHILTIRVADADGDRFRIEAELDQPRIADEGRSNNRVQLGTFTSKEAASLELTRIVRELNGAGAARVSAMVRDPMNPVDTAIEDLCVRVSEDFK